MLDTLELRLGQAHQERLGYVEFLEFLMEDELQRRANKQPDFHQSAASGFYRSAMSRGWATLEVVAATAQAALTASGR